MPPYHSDEHSIKKETFFVPAKDGLSGFPRVLAKVQRESLYCVEDGMVYFLRADERCQNYSSECKKSFFIYNTNWLCSHQPQKCVPVSHQYISEPQSGGTIMLIKPDILDSTSNAQSSLHWQCLLKLTILTDMSVSAVCCGGGLGDANFRLQIS